MKKLMNETLKVLLQEIQEGRDPQLVGATASLIKEINSYQYSVGDASINLNLGDREYRSFAEDIKPKESKTAEQFVVEVRANIREFNEKIENSKQKAKDFEESVEELVEFSSGLLEEDE